MVGLRERIEALVGLRERAEALVGLREASECPSKSRFSGELYELLVFYELKIFRLHAPPVGGLEDDITKRHMLRCFLGALVLFFPLRVVARGALCLLR